METVTQLKTMPRPFDPDRGSEAAALFNDLPADLRDLAAGVGGSAPYLFDLMRREAQWLTPAFDDPDDAVQQELARIGTLEAKELGSGLRQAKRRLALLSGVLDLGGIWSLEQVTGTLTQLAERACDLAIKSALAPLLARDKVPGHGADALPQAAGMFVLAMGKMGAEELNYSSDIDLICLFDQDRFKPEDYHEARTAFVKATRAMCKTLADATGEGYVFRTDLRLRPDPSVTPVCMAMEAAENYYESLGRTWERAAYIKARPVAGDIAAGERFLKSLTPFVWRKHLDFAAIEDAHNMRLAIREHKGLGGPITLPGHNMKLGRGGIREIEFYTQTRQLIAGGRDPSLRVRGTVEGLAALAQAGWIGAELAEELSDHYRFHRMVEHRVQMVQDAQTHDLPKTDSEFERLACLMGRDLGALKEELHARLSAVHTATEGFFAPAKPHGTALEAPVLAQDMLARWAGYPALRSPRAQGLLDRLRPELEARLSGAARPEEALAALDGFLSGLPAGVQLLSLFEANPHLIDLVLDVVSVSPALADYLSRNAQVLDAVIGGGFFADWPGRDGLEDSLHAELSHRAGDYEAMLDCARRWQKEWHFRIGVHVLRGLISAAEAGVQYSDLARATLACLWPVVQNELARKHGPAPGRGAVVLGMGALGAGRMNAQSDLDLIVIYDDAGAEMSEGKRPLAPRPYFARLTQAMITAISAPMAEGRLYEVDMRLRPSGNQGPVATSWPSFQSYQTDEAWTWEHLALTRACVITGPADLSADMEAFRQSLLSRSRNIPDMAKDLSDMRARIASAKPPAGWLDIKAGPGRMQDVELIGQAGTLLAGRGTRDLLGGLEALKARGALQDPAALARAYSLYWQVHLGTRLVSPSAADESDLGPSARDFLQRLTGHDTLDSLRKALEDAQDSADSIITGTLERLGAGSCND